MSRRTLTIISILLLIVVVIAITLSLYGDLMLVSSIDWVRDHYHSYKGTTDPQPPTTKNAFMYFGAVDACAPDKLVAYANGSVAIGSYPYVIGTTLLLDSDSNWQFEQSRPAADFSWQLEEGYLPISISEYTYKNLNCVSRVFCLPQRRAGKTSVGIKEVTIINTGDEAVTVSVETTIRFNYSQQHLSLGYHQGYGNNPIKTIPGLFYRLGSGGILIEAESNPQTTTIKPGESYTSRVQLLFGSEANFNNHIDWSEFTTVHEQTAAYWRNRMASIADHLEDSPGKHEALAALMHILQACENGIRPTLFYRSTFIRDGAIISHCLLEAGFDDLARSQLLHYLSHPWSSGFGPEGDTPGQLVWMAGDYISHTSDTSFAREIWPIVKTSAETIMTMYQKSQTVVAGLVISEQRDPILWGRMDSDLRPIYCNVWLLAGLREAAQLASICGDNVNQQRYQQAFETNKTVLLQYMSENPHEIKKNIRAFIAGVYPTKLFDPNSELIMNLYDLRWPDNDEYLTGEWPYFELAQATAYRLTGRTDRSKIIYQAISERYPYSYLGVYHEGDDDQFMPHLWAAAEAFFYNRNR